MKKLICILMSAAMVLSLCACGSSENNSSAEEASSEISLTVAGVDTSVALDGDSAKIDGTGADLSGSTLTISSSGTYHLSGNGENIRIKVEAGESAQVLLSLEGLTL